MGKTEVVNMGPGGGPALSARHNLRPVFRVKMFLKALWSLECHKTFHAHEVLLVSCAVVVQSLLVALSLEADLTGVVMRADVKLKLEEG